MIVLAHDDDMCAMSGTISILNKKGWEIRVISIPKTKNRNQAQIKACSEILDSVEFFNFHIQDIRNDLNSENKAYQAIPKEEFDEIFNLKLVRKEIQTRVNQFEPSILFTLDNKIGGYGHPEHILISQTIVDLCTENKIKAKYIYQSVYTDHMEETIMKRHSQRMKKWGLKDDGWEEAKKTYDQEGMPEASIQINIEEAAFQKMNYLRSYNERERKTLGFFIPYFEDYQADKYFSVFNREFFRIIKVE